MTPSGLITGTPTKAKAVKIAFTVSNDYGIETRTLTLNVCTEPEITTQAIKDATVGKKYKETIKSSATKPLTWELEGDLPRNIPLFEADKAKISGTPSVNDAGMIRVTLSNPVGEVSKVFAMNVNAVLPKISPNSLKKGTYGKNYSAVIKTSKGTPPVTLLLSGDLPDGLTFDSSTGKLSGTPSETCTDRKITAIAYNMAGGVSQDYLLTINAASAKVTASNSAGTATKSYTLNALSAPELAGKPSESVMEADRDFTMDVEENKNTNKSAYTLPAENVLPENAVNDFVVGYIIVAELPAVSVNVSGMYDFSIELGENAQAGEKLVWLANSSEPSEDDKIAEFFDESGHEIDSVPENRKVNVSVWLNAGKVYKPAIAVRR